jgi:prepilin signal peptidase PulO-like enzyme (type II secretory pathway)
MDLLLFISIFILGTLIGSFINVVGLRYNSGLSISSGRSKCFSCDTPIKWYDLIPVFSYFFLLGRCRNCKSKISLQYPIIELVTGLVFVGIIVRQVSLWPLYSGFNYGLLYSVLFSLYYFVIFSILFVITIYDFRHKIIPNFFVYLFIFLSFCKLFLFIWVKYPDLGTQDLFDILSPFILFSFFASLWLFSSGRWIGFGDAKLVLGIGALLGFTYGVGAVVLGFWIGALWSIFLLFNSKFLNKEKNINLQSELPFAPFLILGTVIVFLYRIDVMNLSSFFGI